ncbi:MAG: hypothetical protein UW30_C0006G0015 [Candidatus Giovannonibacteria bacterium GW2011_GWA2_44_13b]|uniref:Aminotransferase class IV n=2 Tax=Candidatus Giovannoniibacteriota TaxID=1752738 RepID=A0A0G1H542_9BACT|nr:MAG: hypothetical protein UW30_C0006G0015 [Candidatus Giovannonibacteria bacterium GW2011_GWA2_44_13b]OGF82973.1 MAG: hypothetical protein A2924_04455 [Candidatus Giovannonibacteria bacterium RIFCSPLOWO2_01_FULL_44_16]
MGQAVYSKGSWRPWVKIESDLGLWRADGALEVLEAQYGALFHFDEHFERLVKSCSGYKDLDMSQLPSESEVREHVEHLLKKESSNAIVHILVTPGTSADLKNTDGFPEMVIDVRRLENSSDAPPLKLITKNVRRYFPEFKLTAGYGYARRFQAEAAGEGYDNFLYWGERTGILEGPYENFFVVTKTGCLYTPASNVLKGVTRKIFLELAKKSDIFTEVCEVPWAIHLGYLERCSEAFLSSTTKGGIPAKESGDISQIRQIDGYDHFEVGADTRSAELKRLFLEYRENYFASRRKKTET